MTSCLAPHLPMRQSSCASLDWHAPRDDGRCRVIAWTCDCRCVYYELCESGGLAFIRRVTQDRPPTVAETHRVRVPEARTTWQALLTGLAR